jgi:hypothetical protein
LKSRPCHATLRSAIHPIILCASHLVDLVSGVDLSFNPLSVSLARRMGSEWQSNLTLRCRATAATRGPRADFKNEKKNVTRYIERRKQTKILKQKQIREETMRKKMKK